MSIDTTLVGTRYFAGVGVRVVKRLDGVDSENYFVEAAGRKYVLKWYAAADPKSLGEELAAMQWLRGRGVPVPAVVPDRAGPRAVKMRVRTRKKIIFLNLIYLCS